MTDVNPSMKKVETGGISNDSKAEIHDRTGLFVSITALFVSGMCAGLLIAMCLFGPQLLDAKIAAGAADAKAIAQLARQDASAAKDFVDQKNAEFKQLAAEKGKRK